MKKTACNQNQPLLKENDLIAKGIVRRSDASLTEQPAVTQGRIRLGADGRKIVHEKVLEKLLTIDNTAYRIQGASTLELKENERMLRRKLVADQSDDPTLNRYFQEWIARKELTAAKPATPYRYRMIYRNHLASTIGKMRLRDIKRRDVIQLQTALLEDLSPGTVNYAVQLLHQILNEAVDDEIIPRNPADRVRRLQTAGAATATKTNHRALTVEEQNAFLEAAKGSFYCHFFTFMLLTGLRHGEGAALLWSDIDEGSNEIHVRRTLSFDRAGHIITGPPKTRAGERDIPMNAAIRRTLDRQRALLSQRLGRRAIHQDMPVFPSSQGGILHNATANKAICRILSSMEEADRHIPHFSVHALRDTFATRFIEQGGNPQTLKALLGHASLKMTMDLYAQVLPNTKQKEMDMLKILPEEL